MSETAKFTAEPRSAVGKGGARRLRRSGRIPAILYGGGAEPLPISLDASEVARRSRQPGFLSHVIDLDLGGKIQPVLPREVQRHPLTGQATHVDFLRVSATSEITVDVEIVFENAEKSPGLKGGGVLNVVAHTVEIACLPSAIPDRLVIDLTGLEIGDVVHFDALKLPAGARLVSVDPAATIASVAPPTTEAAAPAAGEGEAST
jgi:large subunit ribosomal protein L25